MRTENPPPRRFAEGEAIKFRKKRAGRTVSRVLSPRKDGAAAIYPRATSPPRSIVLPSGVPRKARAGSPPTPVYMNFQPPMRTARASPHGRWALTPPSHPCRRPSRRSGKDRGGCFLLRLFALADNFPLRSGAPCAARTFLLRHNCADARGSLSGRLLTAKLTKNKGVQAFSRILPNFA